MRRIQAADDNYSFSDQEKASAILDVLTSLKERRTGEEWLQMCITNMQRTSGILERGNSPLEDRLFQKIKGLPLIWDNVGLCCRLEQPKHDKVIFCAQICNELVEGEQLIKAARAEEEERLLLKCRLFGDRMATFSREFDRLLPRGKSEKRRARVVRSLLLRIDGGRRRLRSSLPN